MRGHSPRWRPERNEGVSRVQQYPTISFGGIQPAASGAAAWNQPQDSKAVLGNAGRRVRGNEQHSLPDAVPGQVSGADFGVAAGISRPDSSPGMRLAEGALPGGCERADGIPVCEAGTGRIRAEKERGAERV